MADKNADYRPAQQADDLKCFTPGCGKAACEHLRWLETGGGAWVQQCSPTCELQVVRPGKVQCNCEVTDGE